MNGSETDRGGAPAGSWWDLDLPQVSVGVEHHGAGRIAVVTLANPDQRNAMSEPMTQSWVRLMRCLAGDEQLLAVVVTGAGSAFCAGGNLSWIAGDGELGVARLRDRMMTFYRDWLSVRDLGVPVIAAINGHAVGAGLALALACDLRYVADGARLSVPFTSLGLHPGMATTWSLVRVAGSALANDMLLTGRVVLGAEAVAGGLASWAGPSTEVLDQALAAARRIARSAPIATRLLTTTLRGDSGVSLDAALEREALAQAVTLGTEDLAEGIRAAQERRPPEFRGR